jgi:hypothetical protein
MEQPTIKKDMNIWQKLWEREVTEKINMYDVLPITVEELHELLNTNPFNKNGKTTIEELLNSKYRLVRIDDSHGVCPHCGFDCSDWAEKLFDKQVEASDNKVDDKHYPRRNKVVSIPKSSFKSAYDGYSGASGCTWEERYTCPKCGFKFTEDNSSI